MGAVYHLRGVEVRKARAHVTEPRSASSGSACLSSDAIAKRRVCGSELPYATSTRQCCACGRIVIPSLRHSYAPFTQAKKFSVKS